MTGNSKTKKEGLDGKTEVSKRKSLDGERKRSSSTTDVPETPPKKYRRDSDHSMKNVKPRDNRAEPEKNDRSLIRRKLREVLTSRSQSSGAEGSEKLLMDTNSIAKLVGKIEKHMFEKFGTVNKDYKEPSYEHYS